MTEEELIRNIYRKLDGELTDGELRDLEEYLSVNPEASIIASETERISRELEIAGREEPEVDIRHDVLQKINMDKYRQHPQNREVFVRSFWSRPVVKYSFSFVLGVFAGIILFSLLKIGISGLESDTNNVRGTMLNQRGTDNMKVADVLQYSSDAANITCMVRYSQKIVEMQLEIISAEPVKAVVGFDFSAFQVLNVSSLSVNDQTTALYTGNYIQIKNVGDNKFLIQLSNKSRLSQQIDLKLYKNESPIYQNAVQINKE